MNFSVKKRKFPPQSCCRILNEYADIISDPANKLKFINQSIKNYQKIPSFYWLYPPFVEIAFRKTILEKAEQIEPGCRKRIQKLIKDGLISPPHPLLWHTYKYRYLIFLCIMFPIIWFLGTSAASISRILYKGAYENKVIFSEIPCQDEDQAEYTNLFSLVWSDQNCLKRDDTESEEQAVVSTSEMDEAPLEYTGKSKEIYQKEGIPENISNDHERDFPEYITDPIWLVEKSDSMELYSNRLRIITKFEVDNIPRTYLNILKNTGAVSGVSDMNGTTDKIVGILYHTSESDMVPFKPEKNRSLKKYTELLIKYIRYKRLYNYFIDRFGQVYRIVQEEHTAYHAGNSVWSDQNSIYLSLNHAFLGICFEGKNFRNREQKNSQAPGIEIMDELIINENQFKSGKELTDLLRYKYKISQSNCVTHALTSINPDTRLIGFHLDLSQGFPFHEFGLSNKYHEPLPSITEFGFSYDSYFFRILNGRVWPGIKKSENCLVDNAQKAGVSLTQYRKRLNKNFDRYYKALKKAM